MGLVWNPSNQGGQMDTRIKVLVVAVFVGAAVMWAYYKFYAFHWG